MTRSRLNLFATRAETRLRSPALRSLLALPLLVVVGLLTVGMARAADPAAASWVEGVNYKRLPVAIETRDPSKVEVVEVFSYACIHCKTFEPMISAWKAKAPAHVDFQRLPAAFDATWATLAQAYFTAEVLGVTDKVHDLIFSGIHDSRINLADPAELARVFKDAAGIEPDQFNQTFQSFSVRSRVQQADARTRAYRVTGTPTLIVDGRFLIDARMAGGNDKMLEVVDHLVAEQWAQRAKPQ